MSTWEEAYKIMQQASRRLDKLDEKARARALAWLVEKYCGDGLAEQVLAKLGVPSSFTAENAGNGAGYTTRNP